MQRVLPVVEKGLPPDLPMILLKGAGSTAYDK